MKSAVVLLPLLLLTAACTSPNAFSATDRQEYRQDICRQFLSPESTTPNLAGRGRSCVENSRGR